MQSKSHLPPLQGGRWTTRRKAALVEAIANGGITLEEACERYQLSPEEFACWVEAVKQHGTPGLRATRFQIYRTPKTNKERR